MKSLLICVFAVAGCAAYIQTQIAGSCRNGILPVQITHTGAILDRIPLMIFSEHKKAATDPGRTGNCKKDRMRIDTGVETKARLRYLRSLTAKRSGLAGYPSQTTPYLQQDLSTTDNTVAPGEIYDADAVNRHPAPLCYAARF